MSTRLVAWNVNHRAARRRIPSWMTSALASTACDLIVLTEYVEGQDHEAFVRSLNGLGLVNVLLSERAHGQNGVLIAGRHPLRRVRLPIDTAPPPLASNLLMVEVGDANLRVLGIRMPCWTGAGARKVRDAGWQWLTAALNSLRVGATLAIGDFNREPTVDAIDRADTVVAGWRTVMPADGGSFRSIGGARERRLDYALASAEVDTQRCVYDWGFQNLCADARRRAPGVPDHAMLIVDLNVTSATGIAGTVPSIERDLLIALRSQDASGIFRFGFAAGVLLPSERLTADLVPTSPEWGGMTAAEGFSLLFDGYAWAESVSTDLRSLREAVESASSAESLSEYSIDALRAALFGIQRKYHDSPDQPNRQTIDQVLTAIRGKLLARDHRVPSMVAGQQDVR